MAYVDYAYYRDTFGGTAISEAAFKRLEILAESQVKQMTFNRIKENPAEEMKLAICAVAEVCQAYESGEAGIASASIGNKSVSYANVEGKTLEKEVRKAAEPFLSGTGLLYRGFYSGERK